MPPKNWTPQPIDPSHLLTDAQVADFICDGYLVLEPGYPAGLNDEIDRTLTGMSSNPGDGILDAVPQLFDVWNHPVVRGVLGSLLGHDAKMNSHRHWHCRHPSPHSQGWHQDGNNQRHHQVRQVLALYYPHDVTLEMGATVIMPGTHFRNAPTDRMATYGNLRGQVALAVKAGTVAITHYDIWHGGSINRSDRPRHMLKFLFHRASEPTAPAWNHDPQSGDQTAASRFSRWPAWCGQSDHYKQRRLRQACWNHMLGKDQARTTAA